MRIGLRSRLPEPIVELLDRLAGLAAEIGTRAYLVGGVVRDALLHELGRREFPSSPPDLDLLLLTDVVEFRDRLEELFPTPARSEPRLRTLAFPRQGELPEVDLTTARWESYPQPAALPRIVPTTSLSFDLARRDFTVNTLVVSLPLAEESEVMGYGPALEDLLSEKLRILHPQSFIDDPTRLVRLAHYQGLLGFEVEPETLSLVKQAVEEGLHLRVAGSRLRSQLARLCEEQYLPGSARPAERLHQRLTALARLGLSDDLLGASEPPSVARLKLLLAGAQAAQELLGELSFSPGELILAALLRVLSPDRDKALRLARWYELSGGLIEAVREASDELGEDFDRWWQLAERSSPARAALEMCLGGWPRMKLIVWWTKLKQVKKMVDGQVVAELTGLGGEELGRVVHQTRRRAFKVAIRGHSDFDWQSLIPWGGEKGG